MFISSDDYYSYPCDYLVDSRAEVLEASVVLRRVLKGIRLLVEYDCFFASFGMGLSKDLSV